ncbi:MAG: hypothetical protein HY908_04930 [Myxococcales bacterium]|nr:hypothetical protein [Myxococcales bacterium]
MVHSAGAQRPHRLVADVAALVAALLVSLAVAPQALGGDAERARARELGEQALSSYERSDWTAAYERFEQANALVPAPTFQLFMARCKRKQGELGRARALYEAVASQALAADANEQFKQAKTDAQRELAELIARIPSLVLGVSGAPAAGVRVTLDGRAVAPEDLGRPMAVDPGAHEIVASSPGAPDVKRRVDLGEAVTEKVELAFAPASAAAPAGASEGSLAPAAVTFVLAGAALVMGGVTGGLALAKVDDLKSRCTDGHCPVADQPEADKVPLLGTLSTVGFAVGGAGLLVGIVLAVVRPGGSDGADAPEAAALELRIAPQGLGLAGSF